MRSSTLVAKPRYRRNRAGRGRLRGTPLEALGTSAGMPLFLQRLPNATESDTETSATSAMAEELEPTVASVPALAEEGPTHATTVYGQTLSLQGRTNASFRNRFATQDLETTAAEGCDGCASGQCVHVTGTLVSTFTVTTRVTLPRVPRGLTPCQRERVQDAITNVLAPHEQEHVTAFQTYNGTVSTPIDMTVCRNQANREIRAMHNAIESGRRSSAQADSDALDPFQFDVDLDCED
jgi:hypothetical protein